MNNKSKSNYESVQGHLGPPRLIGLPDAVDRKGKTA